jgi:hypothetical protein
MVVFGVVALTALRRDFVKGLCFSLALFVALPRTLLIELPGSLPELTFQRMLLCAVFAGWLRCSQNRKPTGWSPLLSVFVLLAVSRLISLLLSIHFIGSLKNAVSFFIEELLLYIMVSTSITSRDALKKGISALCFGLCCVAMLALTERYLNFNPLHDRTTRSVMWDNRGVTSTYPHRILLGYAMTSGWVLALSLLGITSVARDRRILWGALFLNLAGCYFATSRGPWLATTAAATILLAIGSPSQRRPLILLVCLSALVVVSRPGIRGTISNLLFASLDADTLQGKSYSYRWKLWGVAWEEISKSPERFLFGYGGLSTETMDLSSHFAAQSGGNTILLGYTSWDNQYASDMIEFGCVGFTIELVLYGTVLFRLFQTYRRTTGSDKAIFAGLFTVSTVYLFAMSNVYMFSPQLKSLMCAIMGMGLGFRTVIMSGGLAWDESKEDLLLSAERALA